VASCENGRQPELRILLAHTPDEFAWARAHDFHLVLAGHNHGGQVCVPLLGAVLVPSRHGTRYASGVLTPEMARFLERSVKVRKNIVISGGTGSGKTTLLNVLSGAIPDHERVVTVEDAAELQLVQPHVVGLESRPPNLEGKGEYSIRDLVKNALRMRPDRIVVGECRGGEAIDMLQAMNTGHEGSLTTTHANSPREAVARIETLCLMAGLDLPVRAIRQQIASSVHLIVQQARLSDGCRKVTSVAEVVGIDDDGEVELREIYRFKVRSAATTGKVEGEFEATGYLPSFLDQFKAHNLLGEGAIL
jgi:pilus assembly protein CpaF